MFGMKLFGKKKTNNKARAFYTDDGEQIVLFPPISEDGAVNYIHCPGNLLKVNKPSVAAVGNGIENVTSMFVQPCAIDLSKPYRIDVRKEERKVFFIQDGAIVNDDGSIEGEVVSEDKTVGLTTVGKPKSVKEQLEEEAAVKAAAESNDLDNDISD